MAVLFALFRQFGFDFGTGQTVVALPAMTFNFFLNNLFTYRDRRIKGSWNIGLGLLSFYLVCSIGAISNIGIASYLFAHDSRWSISGIAGILMGAVWNHAVSSVFTWGR
jgi:dolichol-phosphate mannosyltransferase